MPGAWVEAQEASLKQGVKINNDAKSCTHTHTKNKDVITFSECQTFRRCLNPLPHADGAADQPLISTWNPFYSPSVKVVISHLPPAERGGAGIGTGPAHGEHKGALAQRRRY